MKRRLVTIFSFLVVPIFGTITLSFSNKCQLLNNIGSIAHLDRPFQGIAIVLFFAVVFFSCSNYFFSRFMINRKSLKRILIYWNLSICLILVLFLLMESTSEFDSFRPKQPAFLSLDATAPLLDYNCLSKGVLKLISYELDSSNIIDSNVKEHIATFELIGGKGLYEAIVIDKITEPGFVYLKAFEPLKRQPLTETELENDSKAYFSEEYLKMSGGVFVFVRSISIREGDPGYPYAAQFEVWFKSDSGSENRLIERLFRIEGSSYVE